MAQFRVEFVLDQATGKYLAEMYHPDNPSELLVRTEALYPSPEAAVLGVVQLFKNAVLQFPRPGTPPKRIGKPKSKTKAKAKAKARKKPGKKANQARRAKKRK
jgi:hypothetical protein